MIFIMTSLSSQVIVSRYDVRLWNCIENPFFHAWLSRRLRETGSQPSVSSIADSHLSFSRRWFFLHQYDFSIISFISPCVKGNMNFAIFFTISFFTLIHLNSTIFYGIPKDWPTLFHRCCIYNDVLPLWYMPNPAHAMCILFLR